MFGQIQKENRKNKLLPYYDELQEESFQQLKTIKTHFGLSILQGELREPLHYCLDRLNHYIDLYGLKFSKEDHVLFVQIIYDLITMPGTPLNASLSDLHYTLRILLKKKKLLIPLEDLTLPWRPLYEICKKVFWSDYLKQTVFNINENIKMDLEECVLLVRSYFPPSATQEILDEFRPFLCPFDTKAIKFGVQMLSWFLPLYNSSPELADHTYKLWLDELTKLWDTCCNNSVTWDDQMMYLMAWLAVINNGHIDWEDHIPAMYTRILKTFKLPVFYKKTGSLKTAKIFEDRVASWIVSSLGGGSVSQDYLDQLLKTLESYCHFANAGYWAFIIKSFLNKLSHFFICRVRRERYKEPYWGMRTPEHKKLNDEDIRRFVVSMQSISMLAMFSPTSFINFTKVFHVLATLRPDIVVPPLLEKFYSTIDCVTEPHKYMAVLKCVRVIARPMLINGLNSSFPEGKKHVIPLLFAVLPGIDPNDHRKSAVTLQFISTFLNLIPVVDCSSSCSKFSDVTIEEEEAASTTSQFEEFIIQFMDRVFSFIERASQEHVRIENSSEGKRNKLEKHVIDLFRISCTTVFGQLSYPILMVALKKMYNYLMFKIFEREIAGYAVAAILKVFAKVNGEETFKLFIPKLCNFILEAADSQDIKNEEALDSELLYTMLLLSEVVSGTPAALTQYVPMLLDVLEKTLHLKCKEGFELSAQLLSNILSVFSNVYPINFYEHCKSEKLRNEIFSLREWGKGSNLNDLKLEWYIPKEAEISLVENIFWKFLTPELETIEKYSKNEIEICRDDIRCTLTILLSLFSCGNLLEPLDQEQFLKPSNLRILFNDIRLNLGVIRYIKMSDGSNFYKVVIEKMAAFQSRLLKETDDTVSFKLLSTIWSHLLVADLQSEVNYTERKTHLKRNKNIFLNMIDPHFSNVHSVLVEEVALQHMYRSLYDCIPLKQTHKIAVLKLFELATNDYKSVQTVARNILQSLGLGFIDNSFLISEINNNLKVDTIKYAEKFKSTLALLRNVSGKWASFTESYEALKGILPAIVTSMPSEELAVIKLLDNLSNSTTIVNWHFGARLHITQNLLDKAKQLWSNSTFELLCNIPSDDEIQKSVNRVEEQNNKILKDYEELIQDLVGAIQSRNLQWRYEAMAATYIAVLLLLQEPCPIEVVRYYLSCLTHDSISYRKIAIECIVCMLKMSKAKGIKEKVDPFLIKNSTSTVDCKKLKPGPRSDNAWCHYNQDSIPRNTDQWNEVRYVYKCYLGYYTWPSEVFLHSSSLVQPVNDVGMEKLTDVCKEIDLFFSNSANIEKLIEYLCLEEKKGEMLRCYNISLFKYLFKIYGDKYFDTIAAQFEKILDRKEESYQRCAAEMIAGIIRGIKLWSFEKSHKVITWCTPLLRKALDNMTVETQKNWGSSIATAMLHCDVNKSSYLFELLMEEPIKGDAAFKDCGRLYVLQSGVLHSWRLSQLWCKLLEYIKPYLANQYQDLRERLGSVLVTIFETDIDTCDWNRTLSPHVSDFVDYLLPKLEILYKVAPNSNGSNGYDNLNTSADAGEICVPKEEEVEKAILLLKTVCKWCTAAAHRCVYPLRKDFFKFFPLFCLMENYDKDEELKKNCKHTLSLMSFTPVLLNDIPIFIEYLEKISVSNSWSARCTVLDFLQVFAFYNLFLISSQKEWISQIMSVVLTLLQDNRCEVRQKAGEVISGFIHYDIIKNISSLIEKFKKMSQVSLKKNNMNIRHAGVIGLCSFINAYPYTVPAEVPPLFVEIGVHLNDPEPIPSTIRKTLGNFKRTHYSDWNESKLMFTADQMDVFSAIIIPPNHYA